MVGFVSISSASFVSSAMRFLHVRMGGEQIVLSPGPTAG